MKAFHGRYICSEKVSYPLLQNVLAEDASFSGMFHSGAGPRASCLTEYFNIFCQTCIYRISPYGVCNLNTLHHSNHKNIVIHSYPKCHFDIL
jgi:hypothetical protein